MDTDHDDVIAYSEFLAAALQATDFNAVETSDRSSQLDPDGG